MKLDHNHRPPKHLHHPTQSTSLQIYVTPIGPIKHKTETQIIMPNFQGFYFWARVLTCSCFKSRKAANEASRDPPVPFGAVNCHPMPDPDAFVIGEDSDCDDDVTL